MKNTPTSHSPRLFITAALLAFSVPVTSQGATLVGYDFTGGTVGTLDPASSLDPTTAPPANVTASAFSFGSGTPNSTFQSDGGDIELSLLVDALSADNEADAVTDEQYAQFTLDTPSSDFSLDLDSLTLTLRKGGSSANRYLFLRTSLDGYTNNIASSSGTGGLVLSTSTNTSVTFTFDNIVTYNDVSGPVDFRLYTFADDGGTRSVRLDDILVLGYVVAVPEPSTAAFFLAVIVGVYGVARRKRG